MYILFEHSNENFNKEVDLICICEEINNILKFIGEKIIKTTIFSDDKVIFVCENKEYILIKQNINYFRKQGVLT